MKNLILFTVLIFVSAASVFAQTKDEKAKQSIRKVMDEQTAAWNVGNIEGFMKGYWNSPELRFVSGDRVTKGWQQTLDNYKRSYDSRAKMGTLTFSDLDITILSKDAAVVVGSWSLARDVDEEVHPHGKFSLIFRQFKEGWRVVLDHTS